MIVDVGFFIRSQLSIFNKIELLISLYVYFGKSFYHFAFSEIRITSISAIYLLHFNQPLVLTNLLSSSVWWKFLRSVKLTPCCLFLPFQFSLADLIFELVLPTLETNFSVTHHILFHLKFNFQFLSRYLQKLRFLDPVRTLYRCVLGWVIP